MRRGYKVFNPDWTCQGFKYEVGKTYELEGNMKICHNGFHFCERIANCFNYYSFNSKNHVAEVIAHGEVAEYCDKCCTNKIEIVRELSWEDVLKLANIGGDNAGYSNTGNGNTGNGNSGCGNIGDGNTGNGNTGDGNSGNGNSGNRNSGSGNDGNHNTDDGNSGNGNSGNRNTGDGNVGNCNTGNDNTGNHNTGDGNGGYGNTGNDNTGDCNTGNGNSGDRNRGNLNPGAFNGGNNNAGYFNTGNGNTGYGNVGNCNTGNDNTGDGNTGNCNTGDCNVGNNNSGNGNAGDFNPTDHSAGCFCTEQHKLLFFDRETDMSLFEWRESKAYALLRDAKIAPTKWITDDNMNAQEKYDHPEYKTTGGYLKKVYAKPQWIKWWDTLDESDRDIIRAIPNFDAIKFELITGIKA